MFRNRRNSQKPNDELLESFRASYPHLGGPGRSLSVTALDSTAPQQQQQHRDNSPADALTIDSAHGHRGYGVDDDVKDLDHIPRTSQEQWRFTPSIMDPNSFAFTSFANQPPGYYTPTPGGTNTIYHHQAGDLHTPSNFNMPLATPLSLPTSAGNFTTQQPVASSAIHEPFSAVSSHHFEDHASFGIAPQETGFAPEQFHHQPMSFLPVQSQAAVRLETEQAVDVHMQEQSPGTMPFALQTFDHSMAPPQALQTHNDLRFYATLNAPTAMIRQADEIPVTYLNKGQAYSISILDTRASVMSQPPSQYRTFIRISFEDDQQRQKPAACWQLWKEGRGTNEAHHRGGRLQAVEFVDPTQAGGIDLTGKPQLEVDSASFDGFCIVWSPPTNGAAECSIPVRFNFLSTDFSHSKGVKGIPVRLCAKTELLGDSIPSIVGRASGETCYCRVKLFRDHGAERKLSNDVQHVKKTIDKLKQQIAQIESGMKDFGKRKRSGSTSKPAIGNSRPGKVLKHKRTWSVSSASELATRPAAEEDLHIKLQTLTDMFTSTRPASVLSLRGDELDDPDLHPVKLSIDTVNLVRKDTGQSSVWEHSSVVPARRSSLVSPTPSNRSIQSGMENTHLSTFKRPAPYNPDSRTTSDEWRKMQQTATSEHQAQSTDLTYSPANSVPTRIQRRSTSEQRHLSGWIEAVGVDPLYQPPPERLVKPVACFYVQFSGAGGQPPQDNYYRAMYLMQRTLQSFISSLSVKANIEPSSVLRAVRVNQKGLSILVDEEMVMEIPEGQDMVAEVVEIRSPGQPSSAVKREWDAGATDLQEDEDMVGEARKDDRWELRLHF